MLRVQKWLLSLVSELLPFDEFLQTVLVRAVAR